MSSGQQFRPGRMAMLAPIAAFLALVISAMDSMPAQAAGPIRCPIVYYHDIPSQSGMEAHVAAFMRAGYIPTRLSSLLDALDDLSPVPPGCMVLTFDDALQSQFRNALPVLNRWAISGTFFILPSFRDGVHAYMTQDEIRDVYLSGQEIGSHSLNHPNLPSLRERNAGAYWAELDVSRQMIENITGVPTDLFAYPNGAFDAITARDVAGLGYRAAVSTIAGVWHSPEQRYALRRIIANPWEAPSTVMARFTQ